MAEEKKSASKELLVGIDLGTSHTAVMTNRGNQFIVRSVVGYPRDLIGVKLLGEPYAVGEDALERHSYLDLRYPLEDGVLREFSERDLEVTRHLLQRIITMVEPNEDDHVCAVIGVPAESSAENKELLLNMAHEVVDMAVVVSEPFMVAYGLDKLLNSIIIDIGAGTADVCAMKGKMPAADDQATTIKAGNYVDERLAALISERYPDIQMTKDIATKIKEQHSFVGNANDGKEIEVEMRADGRPVICEVSEEIRIACESIVPEIIEQVGVLISSFDPRVQENVLKNIILAGGGSGIRGLDAMIAEELEEFGEVTVYTSSDEPDYAGCRGGLQLANDLPPAYWEQIGEIIGE